MRLHRTLFLLTLALASTSAARVHAQPAPPAQPAQPAQPAPRGQPAQPAQRGQPAQPAQAAPEAPKTTTEAASERAKKLRLEAARLYDEGKFSQAYVAFLAAWAVKQDPIIAGQLADCETNLGKHREAAEHYRYAVKNLPADAKPDDKRRVQKQLDEALKKVGELTVTMKIDGADIALDGAPVGKSPLADSLYVDVGRHTIEARHEGYEPFKAAFEAAPGSSDTVLLTMTPGKAGGANAPADEPAGFDKVRPWIIRGGMGLTVGGLAFGAMAAVLANQDAKSAAALRGGLGGPGPNPKPVCGMSPSGTDAMNCDALKKTGSRQSLRANASVAMFVVGGVAAVTTAGLWTWAALGRFKDDSPLRPLTGVRVVPMADAHEGGVVVLGTW